MPENGRDNTEARKVVDPFPSELPNCIRSCLGFGRRSFNGTKAVNWAGEGVEDLVDTGERSAQNAGLREGV